MMKDYIEKVSSNWISVQFVVREKFLFTADDEIVDSFTFDGHNLFVNFEGASRNVTAIAVHNPLGEYVDFTHEMVKKALQILDVECEHEWKTFGDSSGEVIIHTCMKCGEQSEEKVE